MCPTVRRSLDDQRGNSDRLTKPATMGPAPTRTSPSCRAEQRDLVGVAERAAAWSARARRPAPIGVNSTPRGAREQLGGEARFQSLEAACQRGLAHGEQVGGTRQVPRPQIVRK